MTYELWISKKDHHPLGTHNMRVWWYWYIPNEYCLTMDGEFYFIYFLQSLVITGLINKKRMEIMKHYDKDFYKPSILIMISIFDCVKVYINNCQVNLEEAKVKERKFREKKKKKNTGKSEMCNVFDCHWNGFHWLCVWENHFGHFLSF